MLILERNASIRSIPILWKNIDRKKLTRYSSLQNSGMFPNFFRYVWSSKASSDLNSFNRFKFLPFSKCCFFRSELVIVEVNFFKHCIDLGLPLIKSQFLLGVRIYIVDANLLSNEAPEGITEVTRSFNGVHCHFQACDCLINHC